MVQRLEERRAATSGKNVLAGIDPFASGLPRYEFLPIIGRGPTLSAQSRFTQLTLSFVLKSSIETEYQKVNRAYYRFYLFSMIGS